MDKNKDIFGTAIKAFYEDNDQTDIIVHSPEFDDDIIPVKYLFRGFDEMPLIEQKALNLCKGKVLDVGCGAGSHSLYLQKNSDLEVHAIDTSPGAVEIAKKRGLKNVTCEDYFKITNQKYDTILMLMNGSGIIEKLDNLKHFFKHTRSLLKEGGQILMDSSDLIYLFEDEIEDMKKYYGEFEFEISYKNLRSDKFNWLYVDPNLLQEHAEENNFRSKIIYTGENYDYLASLTMN